MYKSRYEKSSKISTPLKLALVAVAFLGIAFAGYKIYDNRQASITTPTTTEDETINLEPPTEQEKTETDARKEEIVNRDKLDDTADSATGKKQANLTITEANATNVRAYVTGIFEEGGTCTAVATQGSQRVSGTSEGFQNASYTQCAPISWDTPLAGGSWSLTVSYSSATSEASTNQTVEVK